MGKFLGVVVSAIGRQTETYVAEHIATLAPDHTAVCALNPTEKVSWAPEQPLKRLYRSDWRSVEITRRLLSLTSRRALERLDMARFGLSLAKHHIEVVLCEYLPVAVAVLGTCRRMRIPVVAHAHGFDISAVPRSSEWAETYSKSLPLMSDIVVVSNAMK